nr:MAG TPA: DNA-directed RNA polymerase [Caudoviricetes sp.]
MAEYIERSVAIAKLTALEVTEPNATMADVKRVLADIPAADVAPVVRGWWEHVDSSYWRWTPSGGVSVPHVTYRCGRCWRGTAVKTNYCPSCGAKMDEKEAVYD